MLAGCHAPANQKIIQAAALLVDGGRAGTLSRVQELIEFAHLMKYEKIGMAYCYGMETTAGAVRDLLRVSSLKTVSVACTVGGLSQAAVNQQSTLPGVSCSPISQAAQLNAEGVDLAVVIGLCMGHDILFNREFKGDVTTLIVKDRTNGHNPLAAVPAAGSLRGGNASLQGAG